MTATSTEAAIRELRAEVRALRIHLFGPNTSVADEAGDYVPLPVIASAPAAAAAAQTTATAAGDTATAAQGSATAAAGAAAAAQGTADAAAAAAASKTTTFYQTSPPSTVGRSTGDLWVDTDNGNAISTWVAGAWTLTPFAAAAISATARQLGSVATYRQATAPAAGLLVGDLWIDSDDNRLYRWEGTVPAWVAVPDAGIAAAAAAAVAASNLAATKTTTFYQTSTPSTSGRTTGDLWVDTDDGNRIYTWNGSWTSTQFAAAALSATARQLGAVTTYRQATAPASGMLTADFWIDSDDNKLYRWDGATWVASQDAGIAAAALAASNAQGTANSALTSANGKNRVYSQGTAPTGTLIAGDVWMDTANGNRLSVHTGSAWVLQALGTGAFSAAAVTATVLAGTAVDGKTVTGATLRTAASGQRVQIDSTNGLVGINSVGTTMTSINPGTGLLTATGAIITGEVKTSASGPRVRMAQVGGTGAFEAYSGDAGELLPARFSANTTGVNKQVVLDFGTDNFGFQGPKIGMAKTSIYGAALSYVYVDTSFLELNGTVIVTGDLDMGAWDTWTPVWTTTNGAPSVGNGSLIGRYRKIGRVVFVNIYLSFGSTTNGGTGGWGFSLPEQAMTGYEHYLTLKTWSSAGWNLPGWGLIASGGSVVYPWSPISPTNGNHAQVQNANAAATPGTGVPTTPANFSFTTGNNVSLFGRYESIV